MKRLIFKIFLYAILIILALEVWIRVLYLGKDIPSRYVDANKVEKWVPNQNGFSVTGNRRQNFSEYRINDFGFNSHHEFKPTSNKIEIALVGDSFIEGFHQHYYNSIGNKIESKLSGIEVYEYGYAGYDMADQLHLISAYKEHFELIDHVFLGIKFSNDLRRGEYEVVEDRMRLEKPPYTIIKKSKLLIYLQSIGIMDPLKRFVTTANEHQHKPKKEKTEEEIKKMEEKYTDNFKSLVSLYGYDKEKFVLLLNSTDTSQLFINYLNENNYQYIDYGPALDKSKRPTTLIYDAHWNNKGREIIADVISQYYLERLSD